MPKFHVVTDNAARLNYGRPYPQQALTIVPYAMTIGGKRYREDIELTNEELMEVLASQSKPPTVTAPSVNDYAAIYARLSQAYDGIISIHTSRELSESWRNARTAAQQVSGRCEIAVVDSRSICAGQGMLARLALDAINHEDDFEKIVNIVRGAVERVYSVYYVEGLEYLLENELLSASRATLGTMLGVKPFLSIEEGNLIVIEKVRNRSQAIERLIEFLVEFEELDDAVIVQHRTSINEQVRTLQDRLSAEFPGRHFPYIQYSSTLAALIGTQGMGVVVLESETGFANHD